MSGQLKNEIHSCDICLREAIFYEYQSKSYRANLCVRCLGIAISRHKNIRSIKIINTNQVIVSQNKSVEPKLEVERVKRPPAALSKVDAVAKKPCPEPLKPAEDADLAHLIRHEVLKILRVESLKQDKSEVQNQSRGEAQKQAHVNAQKLDTIHKIKKT